jgi:hypothetical protein
MESVRANFAGATGKPVEQWATLAKAAGVASDARSARKWLREEQGLTTVQATYVLHTLFPASAGDEEMVAAQYSGAKAPLRAVYDALVQAARKLGADVMIAPRKSQVTFARDVTFAVVRAAAKDRVDLALRLPGEKATARLAAEAKASGSDPTHKVRLRTPREVDAEVKRWLARAYEGAKRG